MKRKGNWFYLIFVSIYFLVRDYPYGSAFQSVLDVSILMALLSWLILQVIKRRKSNDTIKNKR